MLHKPILAHPGPRSKCRKQERESQPWSHSLAPTPPPRAAMIRRPSRAQLTRKRVPTQCHGRAGEWQIPSGGSRQGLPEVTKRPSHVTPVACVVERKEGQGKQEPARPGAHAPNRQVSQPNASRIVSVCLQATRHDCRTSLTIALQASLYVSPTCGVPRDDAPALSCEGMEGREIDKRASQLVKALTARAIPTETATEETPIVAQPGLAGRRKLLPLAANASYRGSEVALSPIPDLSLLAIAVSYEHHVTYHVSR
jgi:hypothetical protein